VRIRIVACMCQVRAACCDVVWGGCAHMLVCVPCSSVHKTLVHTSRALMRRLLQYLSLGRHSRTPAPFWVWACLKQAHSG